MVANFNSPQAAPPKTSLDSYDFSWLGRGYAIKVKHNIPTGGDQRDSPSVSAIILKDGEELGYEYNVRVVTEDGRAVSGPKDLTDERIIMVFDELKARFEKVSKAEKYLKVYPSHSTVLTPRPPVMRDSASSMRP